MDVQHKLYKIEQQINKHVSSIKSLLAQTSHTPSAVYQHFILSNPRRKKAERNPQQTGEDNYSTIKIIPQLSTCTSKTDKHPFLPIKQKV